MSDDVTLRRVGPDLRCRWCGEPVSQLGTRTPRRYCRRSHRQRAYEAERLGLPMKKDRATSPPAAPVPAARDGEGQAALFLAELVERTSVDVDQEAVHEAAVPASRPLPPVRRSGRWGVGRTAAAIPLLPYEGDGE